MNFNEFSELSNELFEQAWDIFYKIEILLGYCEHKIDEPIPAPMVSHILTEIRDKQSQIIDNIDIYTTKIGYEFLNQPEK